MVKVALFTEYDIKKDENIKLCELGCALTVEQLSNDGVAPDGKPSDYSISAMCLHHESNLSISTQSETPFPSDTACDKRQVSPQARPPFVVMQF